jgi:hypothetical protein
MDPKKLDWIISIIREEMMTANPPGKGGGVGGQTDPTGKEGPAGFDSVMSTRRRKGPQIKLPPGSRKRWMNK